MGKKNDLVCDFKFILFFSIYLATKIRLVEKKEFKKKNWLSEFTSVVGRMFWWVGIKHPKKNRRRFFD